MSAVFLLLSARPLGAADPDVIVIAVMDLGFVDTSVDASETTEPDEARRLERATGLIRESLSQLEHFLVVDEERTRLAVATADSGQYLHECNGCDIDLARKLDADWVLIGWVQKVSNLILNLNVLVKDVETGAIIATAFVDFRGNTDKSWHHATRYLLERLLLRRLEESAARY